MAGTDQAAATVDADVARLDAALMRLRRLWTPPRAGDGMRAGLDEDVELSTVLVVDALARGVDDVPPYVGAGVAEVADRIDVTPSTASRLVVRAVAAGMVERRACPADARRADLRLTEAGRALHGRARRFRFSYLARVLTGWSPEGIAALAASLDAFADSVANDHPSPPSCCRLPEE